LLKISDNRGVFWIHAVLTGAVSLWAVLPPFCVHAQDGGAGGVIRGTVGDEDFGDPLAGARVTVQETGVSATSAEGGIYRIENVAEGVYTLTVAKPGYIRSIQRDVIVRPGQVTDANLSLEQEVYELEPLLVQAEELIGGGEVALLELRQDTSALMDSIGADLISKAGASDAGDALKLVVGTTVQDGKYVTVRGLADRYTKTRLNGMSVVSPDPEKRAAQVDVFPSSAIESLNVSKTFTPDLPGEATGGDVNIILKSIPEERILKFSVGAGFNSQTTFNNNFLTYNGGGINSSGIDGTNRDLPELSETLLANGNFARPPRRPTRPLSATDQEAIQVLDSFTNAFDRGFLPVTEEKGPDYNASITVGDKFVLDDDGAEAGILMGLNYKRKFRTKTGTKSRYDVVPASNPAEEGTVTFQQDEVNQFQESTDELNWSALIASGYRPHKDHLLSLSVFHSQAAEDNVEVRQDDEVQNPGFVNFNNAFDYTERSLSVIQAGTTSTFDFLNDLKLQTKASVSRGSQDQPDIRLSSFEFEKATGDFVTDVPGGTATPDDDFRRLGRNIEEIQFEAAADLELPFDTWVRDVEQKEPEQGKLKFGPGWLRSERDFDQEDFFLAVANGAEANPFFIDENLGNIATGGVNPDGEDVTGIVGINSGGNPQLGRFYEVGPTPADYEAEQTINSFYAMVELPVTPRFEVTVGARVESTNIETLVVPAAGTGANLQAAQFDPVRNVFNVGPISAKEIGSEINQVDFLPAVSFSYEFVDDMFVRASWSQTVARPTFRELASVLQLGSLGDNAFIGNSELSMSRSTNYDLRYEWFPNPGDVFSTSIFYKELKNPIELIGIQANSQRTTFPENFPRARLWGFEVEGRKNLGFINEVLGYFTVGANFTYIQSDATPSDRLRVSLGNTQPFGGLNLDRETQPLQGQPEFLFNANVTFDYPEAGTSMGVFVNWEGEVFETSAAGGADFGTFDLYSDEVVSVDLTLSQKLNEWLKLTLGAKNVLDPKIETFYKLPDDTKLTADEFRKGIDFSVKLSAEF